MTKVCIFILVFSIVNRIPEGLLGTRCRVADVTFAYKPWECQLIRHNYSTLNIYIDLFSKLALQWCTSHRNLNILILCKTIQLEERYCTGWESRAHSSAPGSPGRGGGGGAKCKKQSRSHMCLQPSLIRRGRGSGIQKVYKYLMSCNINTNFLRNTWILNDT
jgi:hypothetical protein